MSYRIEYDFHGMHRRTVTKERPVRKLIVSACCLAAVVFASCCVGVILQAAICGDIPLIRSAADQMVAEIQNGESIRDSVSAFCRDILLP
jgi:hypothetical protein